jgi:hypothetical protein
VFTFDLDEFEVFGMGLCVQGIVMLFTVAEKQAPPMPGVFVLSVMVLHQKMMLILALN